MILRTRNKKMSGTHRDPIATFFQNQGCDKHGRRQVTGIAGGARLSPAIPVMIEFMFVFYALMGGNPFFVVLANSSPIMEHRSKHTSPDDAAFEALLQRCLVHSGAKKPTNIIHVNGVFGLHCVHFVQVSETDLVSASSFYSLFSKKPYSLVDPQTGKSRGGKVRTITGFGVREYQTLLSALVPSGATLLPSLASFASGGGGGGGGVAVAGGGGGVALAGGGGGGGPAASVADRKRLTEVPEMDQHACNSFVLLILANPLAGILLVRTSSDGCWGLIGGMVDAGETPLEAAIREFKDETKSELPRLDASDFGTEPNKPIKFLWSHRSCYTGIYCGKTTASFSDFQRKFKPNREICEIGVFTPQEILQMALSNQLRKCGRKSIITILLHLGLIV
jgi:ADP-ribose pyrophosphatase YjhB (NUDIX family)